MAGIPMSALRRALAEMSERAPSMGLGSHVYGAIENGARGSAVGATLGAGGGLLANMPDVDSGETTSQYGERLLRGVGTGAAIGAGLGPASLAVAGGRGLRWGLREALAEAAAERGIGRAAAREASHVDDAARFGEAIERRDVPLVEEMRVAGQRPFARAPGAMDEMNELGAANRILQRLKMERRTASDPEEIADLDGQISELNRLLGLE